MDEDIRRRFNLSEGQPRKPFRLTAEQGPTVNTKDNAQPVIPPPRTQFLPHPRLAPPGAVGVRLSQDAAKFMDKKREERGNEREFNPFTKGYDKSRGWER